MTGSGGRASEHEKLQQRGYKISVKCHPGLRGNGKEFPRPRKEWVSFINTQKVAEWWK